MFKLLPKSWGLILAAACCSLFSQGNALSKYEEIDTVISDLKSQGYTEAEIAQDIVEALQAKNNVKSKSYGESFKAFVRKYKKPIILGGVVLSAGAIYCLWKKKKAASVVGGEQPLVPSQPSLKMGGREQSSRAEVPLLTHDPTVEVGTCVSGSIPFSFFSEEVNQPSTETELTQNMIQNFLDLAQQADAQDASSDAQSSTSNDSEVRKSSRLENKEPVDYSLFL